MTRKVLPKSPCPCGSGDTYKVCCAPYHKGTPPPTPEKLMRARYTAYAAGDARFIIRTTHPDSPYYRTDQKAWFKELKAYTDQTQFLALNVIDRETDGDVGWVQFRAVLMQSGRDASFTERSRFERLDGRWLYVVREK
jgi:SEC-C motif-containing protein